MAIRQHVNGLAGLLRRDLAHLIETQKGVIVCRRNAFEAVGGRAPRLGEPIAHGGIAAPERAGGARPRGFPGAAIAIRMDPKTFAAAGAEKRTGRRTRHKEDHARVAECRLGNIVLPLGERAGLVKFVIDGMLRFDLEEALLTALADRIVGKDGKSFRASQLSAPPGRALPNAARSDKK